MFHARVKSSTTLPIVRRHQLYLTIHGQGDDARFARLFRETWLSLPLTDRRQMLKHWQSRKTAASVPRIELLNGWMEPCLTRNFQPRFSRALGQCSFGGKQLRFHAAVVDWMPECHVKELIAHELAHVFLLASGDFSRRPICEIRADLQMTRWDFNPYAMDEWIQQNIRGWTKEGHVRWHEPALPRDQVQPLLNDWSDGRFHPRYLTSRGQPVSIDTWIRAIQPSSEQPIFVP